MSNRWSFLLPARLTTRFGLSALLIFVTIVCVALGAPHLTLALVTTAPFLLVGGAIIRQGWPTARHRVVVRCATVIAGLVLIAAGCWVFAVMMPR